MLELPEGKNWFWPSDVARMFGVSKKTVYRWFACGELMGVRWSARKLKFRRADILAYAARWEEE